MIRLKQILTEQSVSSKPKTTTTANSPTTKKPTTINLYKDPADHISFDTGVIRYPKELDTLLKTAKGTYVEFMVATNNHGDIILRWFTKYPDELREYAATAEQATGNIYFNKNVCAYLKRRHIRPKYNPNATFAQNTGTPGQPGTTA